MPERVKTIIIVTALALAFWVFAEAESLSERTVNARFELTVEPADRDTLRVTTDREFQNRLAIELRGPRAALEAVQRLLANPVRLTPEQAGIAIEDGTFTLDLRDTLQELPAVTDANVEIVSVRPSTLTGALLRLDTIQVPIVTRLAGFQTEATPTVTPPTATVRIPALLTQGEREELRVVVRATRADFDELPPGETVQVRLPTQLERRFATNPDIELLTPEDASIAFAVRSTSDTARVDSILWITYPVGQSGAYEIEVNPADRIVPVTVTGPTDDVTRIESGEWPLVAVVSLDAAQLLESDVAVDLRWFALTGGGLRSLPATIEVESEKTSVILTITTRDTP